MLAAFAIAAMPSPAHAQDLGLMPSSLGRFSVGAGAYQAPGGEKSSSGVYGLARFEITQFELEIDYGLSDQNFFLGAADYLYYIPMAQGLTGTEAAIGGGITFVNDDPSLDESKFGPNLLAQIRFMDSYAVQLRHDFLGGNSNLWTFGLSYSFN